MGKMKRFTSIDNYVNHANVASSKGKIKEAIRYYEEVLKIDPNHAYSLYNLGLLLKNLNKFDEAIDAFKKAISIEPNIPQLYNDLGIVLGEIGSFDEEMNCYNKAISLDPNYGLAWGNLGTSYRVHGNLDKAIESFQKAIKLSPGIPDFYINLGLLLQEKGLFAKAIENFKEALNYNPNSLKAYSSLFLLNRQLCSWEGLPEIEQKIDGLGEEDPFASILRNESFEKNFEVAQRFSNKLTKKMEGAGLTFVTERPKEGRKIRIGYLSADFRNHPIGQMVATMFSHHNRNKFAVFGYSYGENDNSIYRTQAEKGMDKFIEFEHLKNQDAAEKIYEDSIDILIDLTGYTADNRMEILAIHPANIQISWLGFPGTSGANFFDYIIVDKIIVPEKDSAFFSEKLIYLPHSYQINNNKIGISSKKYSRSDFGLPEKGFVFASFNQAYKIEPVMFAVWMSILKKVPDSVLWLWEQDKEASDNLRKEAVARGVDPSQLIFAGRLSKEEHLARIKLADLGLDTRIYGGHTTTSDFLWAGVPVVTKLGNHFASRVCASLMTEAGIPELIAKNLKDYEDLAVSLAKDKNKLEKFRERLTHKNLESSLYNTRRFVKNLEDSYQKIWNKWGK